MDIIQINKFKKNKYNTSIALGNFDGVHIGHRNLIEAMIKDSKELNIKSSVLLFANHTKSVVKGQAPSLLTDNIQRTKIIKDLGVDILYKTNFNSNIRNLSPEDFVTKILVEKLNVKSITVGYNYRFGYKAVGDVNDLKDICNKYQIKLNVINPIMLKEEIISSTKIRNYLELGMIEKANNMLGRNYTIRGKIVIGKQIGHKLGFPTANIELKDDFLIPKNGVYHTKTNIMGKTYLSVTSIGKNPTFDEKEIKIETHILNFDKKVYGKDIEIELIRYLRGEIRFNSLEDLKKQIKYDIKKVIDE